MMWLRIVRLLPVLRRRVAGLRISHLAIDWLLVLRHWCEDRIVTGVRVWSVLVKLNLWGSHC
jgi:hypothetical protein